MISQKRASALQAQPTRAVYVNPILRHAIEVFENLVPLLAPSIQANMYELVVRFIQVPAVQQSAPHFLFLAKIAITITVSTASCERGFSLMKLLLTRLRNRMSQEMLDALMRINLLGGAFLTASEIRDIVMEWYSAANRRA